MRALSEFAAMTKTLDDSEFASIGTVVGTEEVVGTMDVVKDMVDDGPEVIEASVVEVNE